MGNRHQPLMFQTHERQPFHRSGFKLCESICRTLDERFRARLATFLLALALALTFTEASGYQALALTGSLQQDVRIEGVVLDELNAPVASARVSLLVGTSVVARTTTLDDGKFVFSRMVVSEATLIIEASGFARVERKWSRGKAADGGLRIVLSPATFTERVVVTATRTETRLGDTAASIITLSSEELATNPAARLDDALRQVPGFQLFRRSGSRTANPTSQGVSLRGTGASGASRALVLEDDIPLNDPFGGWVYWGRVPRAAISRVEVLRGGASHLYGSGALGGVINIITRTPSAPSLSLELSYGNQQTPNANFSAGGSKGKWAANLSAEFFSTDGYILVDERERGSIDTPAGARNSTFDLKLERQLFAGSRLFVRGAIFGEARANGTPLQTNRTHLRQLSAGGDLELKPLGNFNIRAYGGTEVFDQNFSAVAADRNSETLTRVQRVPSQFAGMTLQWSRVVNSIHTLAAGLEAREVRGASDEIVFVQNRASSLVGAGGRERTIGLFIEDIIRLTRRLFITAGLRVDGWRNFAAQSSTRSVRGNAPAVVSVFTDRTETAFSPHLSALYQPREELSLFVSVYRAFRQPTLNELYRSFRVGDVLTLANENLRAERLTGGEAGMSLTAFDKRASLRGTFFWSEIARPIANLTLNVSPNLITRQRENLGRTRARGLEVEAEIRWGARWALTGSYLLTDSTVKSFPVNAALEGLRIPQVPRHQFTFRMRYQGSSRFVAEVQGRFGGAQFDDDLNSLRLDPYFTLDAFASRKVRNGIEVFAAAENLLGQRYDVGRTPVRTLGPPLLLRGGIRFRFGAR